MEETTEIYIQGSLIESIVISSNGIRIFRTNGGVVIGAPKVNDKKRPYLNLLFNPKETENQKKGS